MTNSIKLRAPGRALFACAVLLLAACSRDAGSADPVISAAADSQPAAAEQMAGGWTLSAADSRLSFVSIKNNAIAEVHTFTDLRGTVSEQGKVALAVPLASVATGIAIRDQRLRELLFEVGTFPQAAITLEVDAPALRMLSPGEHEVLKVAARLDLHGFSYPLPVEVRVSRTGEASWLVTSERPAIVEVVNFGMINGVDELRKVAGLRAIASAIPVTFALVFTQVPETPKTSEIRAD